MNRQTRFSLGLILTWVATINGLHAAAGGGSGKLLCAFVAGAGLSLIAHAVYPRA